LFNFVFKNVLKKRPSHNTRNTNTQKGEQEQQGQAQKYQEKKTG
jgi:hypothetical protein